MWEREIFDTDLYHLVGAFIIYSMLGWLVESIYMSFCNRKITNRGFGKGPFCPIYGVGAMVGYIILSPLKGNYLGIYIVGAVSATLLVYFLQSAVYGLVDRVHREMGVFIIGAILLIVFVDYVMQFMKVFNIDIEEQKEKIEERVKAFASRWS